MKQAAAIASRTDSPASFVEWGAVLAGAVLAAALSFVLLTFGAAIGLSATSPWANSGLSVKVIATVAVFWALAQQIGSLLAGGYVAGRMRSRWHEAGDETEFRDGLHGGLVWAIAVLVSAFLAFATASFGVRTGAEVASTAAGAASRATNPMDNVLDAMLRSGATNQQPSGTQAGTPQSRNQVGSTSDEVRSELSRILASAVASGSLTAENRSHLANIVAQRSGVSQQEAEKRVDDAISAARTAADKVRRAAILTGFVTAAGLVLSLGAAWWAAIKGGDHRDNSVPARFQFDRRRQSAVS